MDQRRRRELIGVGLLTLAGNVLGGLLHVVVRITEFSATDSTAAVLAPLLILQDVTTAIQVGGLVGAIAVGWFVARGPGGAVSRVARSVLVGAVGTVLFVLFAELNAWPAFDATYPELGFGSWFETERWDLVALGGASGAAGALTGALVPLTDEFLASDSGEASGEAGD